MGRTGWLIRAFGFVRHLLEGRRGEDESSPWTLDSLEKVLLMWPAVAPNGVSFGIPANSSDLVFAHLRRLYRYGFRLSIAHDGLRLRQFFADGRIYRPEGYSRESRALITDLAHLANEKNPLRSGQCRVARAKPVLRALGFPDLDSADGFAIQFACGERERWIFIDSRPELFRREIAAAVSMKLADLTTEKATARDEAAVSEFESSP